MIGTQGRARRPAVLAREGGGAQRKHRPDYMLVVLSLMLLVIGLIVIYSISPGLAVSRGVSENYYVTKQLIAVGLGAVSFLAMSLIPLEFWKRMQRPLIGAAVIATVIALVIPVSPDYPAHRWVRVGGLSFQSVELIKFAIIFVLGAFLVERIRRRDVHDLRKTVKPLAIVVLVLGIVVAKLQSDLGSMAVMVAMIVAMCYMAGFPLKRLALAGVVIALLGVLAISTTAYRRERLLSFMHPEQNCQTTSGYQACQALIAVGSGGVVGKGLGQSVQAYGYLPEAANDSIFAIYAEKFGFVGGAVLVFLFMALFSRLKNIVERASDHYSRLIITGILAWFSTQTIINIGAMIGLLPLKGITLPFVSYGGTSIIFVAAAIGLAYNISRYTTYGVNTDLDDSLQQPVPAQRDTSLRGRIVSGGLRSAR